MCGRSEQKAIIALSERSASFDAQMLMLLSMFRRRQWLDSANGNSDGAAMLAEAAAEEAAAAAALTVRRVGTVEDLRCLEENLDSSVERK